MNRNQLSNLIENFKHSIEYAKELRIKSFYKMFVCLNKQVPLYETLATYTKNDLDDVRKDLDISGISSLNKLNLAEALVVNIKRLLPEILKKFTDSEYKLLKKMVEQNGILKYKEEFFSIFSYLRRFGIVGCFKDSDDQNYIFIPEDILLEINSLINNITIVSEIKQNEKITKLIKGFLFYYGAIPFHTAYDMITNYIKKELDMVTIFNIIYETSLKDEGVYFYNNYWYSKQIDDIEGFISQQNIRSGLNYFSLTENQVLDASKFDFVEWNKYDRRLINYLCDNYDILKDKVLEYIGGIKLNFKIGNDFNDVVKEFSSNFNVENIEQVEIVVALITAVYNNSIQWELKGHSPSQLSNARKNDLHSISDDTIQTSNIKIGRNAPCPCGSGKKYKNCCLK